MFVATAFVETWAVMAELWRSYGGGDAARALATLGRLSASRWLTVARRLA